MLFAVSVIVFLIFNVIPNSSPAQRMAGKNATPQLVASITKEWGFDKSLPDQYVTMMKKVFSGELISYNSQANRRRRNRQRDPGDLLPLHRRGGDLDVLRDTLRLHLRGPGGQLLDRR